MLFNFYAKNETGVFPVDEKEIGFYNHHKHDIFWTPQEFSGFGVRKLENLKAIRFVCADFDNVTVAEVLNKPILEPSFVISTRGGVHVYWQLKEFIEADAKTPELYRNFVEERLVPLGADKNAKDVSRLLRPAFMRYWRDSKNNLYDKQEIYTDIVYESDRKYTWAALEKCFLVPVKKEAEPHRSVQAPQPGGDLWSKANRLDCRAALERLSGTEFVSMEKFTFKNTRDGTARIIIDGKPRNCWLDKNGLIGSTAEGGPAIPNWLYYYHRDWKRVAEILKQVFPELGHV